ncbi:choice-of-anchor E domain-containing protein [Herbaspirillum sp. NPDC087042]|uniref:PEP-CTERM sorting domain-containing protein n=1 Tax=Herbaspirillum sp. NPDC087042 TaxID=3364004 RepID=UPI0038030676
MKKHLLSLFSAFVATLALLGPAPASATIVTSGWQSQSFNFSTVNASTNLSFDGFDASLGTLLGVVIKFSLNETLNDLAFNMGNSALTVGNPVKVSATSTITASGPLGLTTVNQLTTTPYSGSVTTGLSTIGTATLSNYMVGPTQLNGNMSTLGAYIGGSNSVTIAVTGVGTQSGSLSPSVMTGYNGSANGIVYLQYIYAIPEPTMLALFALGLLMLTATTWRRRQG